MHWIVGVRSPFQQSHKIFLGKIKFVLLFFRLNLLLPSPLHFCISKSTTPTSVKLRRPSLSKFTELTDAALQGGRWHSGVQWGRIPFSLGVCAPQNRNIVAQGQVVTKFNPRPSRNQERTLGVQHCRELAIKRQTNYSGSCSSNSAIALPSSGVLMGST